MAIATEVKSERETQEQKRRNERLAILLLLLIHETEDHLHQVARDYGRGDITPREFGDDVYAVLPFAHAQAAYLGRRRAGIQGALDDDDVRFGSHSAEEQEQFLQGFVEDLGNGRYLSPNEEGKPETDVAKIEKRLTLYAMALAGTANEAWMHSLPDDTLFYWRDVRDKAECSDCEKWALQGPYTRESLPAVPGDGKSQCKLNCRCELVTEDGERSFDLRHLFDGEKLIDGD